MYIRHIYTHNHIQLILHVTTRDILYTQCVITYTNRFLCAERGFFWKYALGSKFFIQRCRADFAIHLIYTSNYLCGFTAWLLLILFVFRKIRFKPILRCENTRFALENCFLTMKNIAKSEYSKHTKHTNTSDEKTTHLKCVVTRYTRYTRYTRLQIV